MTDLGLIIFCWGDDNNSQDAIRMLKTKGIHGIIYDKIYDLNTKDVKVLENSQLKIYYYFYYKIYIFYNSCLTICFKTMWLLFYLFSRVCRRAFSWSIPMAPNQMYYTCKNWRKVSNETIRTMDGILSRYIHTNLTSSRLLSTSTPKQYRRIQ